MHVVFMPYGVREAVERMLSEMRAEKFKFPVVKKDGTKEEFYINGSIRQLPFGFLEYVFPEADLDNVLNTLINPDSPDRYSLDKISFMGFKPLDLVKKFLKIEDIPDYKKDKKYLWNQQDVNTTVIGIRKDEQGFIDKMGVGDYFESKHEAL